MSERGLYWPDIVVGVGAVLIGVVLIGGLVYGAVGTSVTRADYESSVQRCEELAGESRLADTGLGMETVPLNESDVRACENTSFREYRRSRLRSMRSTPLNAVQWGWVGGTALLFVAVGGILLRRQTTGGDHASEPVRGS